MKTSTSQKQKIKECMLRRLTLKSMESSFSKSYVLWFNSIVYNNSFPKEESANETLPESALLAVVANWIVAFANRN